MIVLAQGVVLLEAWDRDKYTKDEYIGGAQCSSNTTSCGILASHSESATRAGGCVLVEKYIDSPNEEFTETMTLYENGVALVKADDGVSARPGHSTRNFAADGNEYRGQGSHTGIVSFQVFRKPRHSLHRNFRTQR